MRGSQPPDDGLGPVPEDAWQGRARIGHQERETFAAAVQQREREARAEQGYAEAVPLSRLEQAAVSRKALGGALVACGMLVVESHRSAGRT
jgi:hypothetical protein